MPAAKLKKQWSLARCKAGGSARLCRFGHSLEGEWQSAQALSVGSGTAELLFPSAPSEFSVSLQGTPVRSGGNERACTTLRETRSCPRAALPHRLLFILRGKRIPHPHLLSGWLAMKSSECLLYLKACVLQRNKQRVMIKVKK